MSSLRCSPSTETGLRFFQVCNGHRANLGAALPYQANVAGRIPVRAPTLSGSHFDSKMLQFSIGLEMSEFCKTIAYFGCFGRFGTFGTMLKFKCHRTGRLSCIWASVFQSRFLFDWFRRLYSLHHQLNPASPILFLNDLHFFHLYLLFHRLVDHFRARHAGKLSRVVCFYGKSIVRLI